MLDWLFMLFLILAIILFFVSIAQDLRVFWNTTITIIDILLWYILAAAIMQIEIPYQIYNASSSQIETGHHTFTSPISPYIMYFFYMMATITFIYFVAYILGPAIYKKWMR